MTISPEEQKAIAILHYTQSGTTGDPYRFFKYDDHICIDNTTGQTSFNVTLTSIMYHRLTGATSGATFTMGTVDKKMVSNYKQGGIAKGCGAVMENKRKVTKKY